MTQTDLNNGFDNGYSDGLDSVLDDGFVVPELADWTAAAHKVLRGRPFAEVLVSMTSDDLDIQPLYTATDSTSSSTPVPVDLVRLERGWDVRQQFSGDDPDACNRAVLEGLERGATSVELIAPTQDWTLDALTRATKGVWFELAAVVLAPHANIDTAQMLVAVIKEHGTLAATPSWLGLDPIGEFARGGSASTDDVVNAAVALLSAIPRGRTLTVDSTRYAEAGATQAQELAYSIATGVAYLRGLEAAGVDVLHATNSIGFRLSVGADQFVNIAKLRAARCLWARVLAACGVEAAAAPQVQQAVTNRAIFSRLDPWVNIVRATSAALAAAVAAVDALTVLPFNEVLASQESGVTDDLAQRVARNTQTLLIEEAQLARVIDPAAGSWFVESLTDRLARRAWSEFVAIEASGGIEMAIADGSVEAAINQSWQRRLQALHTRSEVITGVSQYPYLGDQADRGDQGDLGDQGDRQEFRLLPESPAASVSLGLPLRRLAAPFEALRDTADRHALAHGERLAVHIVALGDLAAHSARSTWVTNLLAVAGIVASGHHGDGSLSPLEAEVRFSESAATVAVICSTDAIYATRGEAVVLALREAGAARVILAGQPAELGVALAAAGVDEFWHEGMDVFDALTRLQSHLGAQVELAAAAAVKR